MSLGALVVLAGVGYAFMNDSGTFKGAANMNFRSAPPVQVAARQVAAQNNQRVSIISALVTENMSSQATTLVVKDNYGNAVDLQNGQRIQVYAIGQRGDNLQIAGSDVVAGVNEVLPMSHPGVGRHKLTTSFAAGLTYNARLMGSNGNLIAQLAFDPNHMPATVSVTPVSSTTATILIKDVNNTLVNLPVDYRLQVYEVDSQDRNLQVAGSDSPAGLVTIPRSAVGTYSFSMQFRAGYSYNVRLTNRAGLVGEARFSR